MSRYRGAKVKLIRKLGILPGLTKKKPRKINNFGKDNNPNVNSNKKSSEYGIRLKEKQKLKFNYGLTEGQLFRYVKEARRRKGVTGLILFQLLEMRLDTICFNLGFGKTMGQARQLVNHGHIMVNQKIVSIPSFQCRLKDQIGIKEITNIKSVLQKNIENNQIYDLPSHLHLDKIKVEATVLNYCDREDVALELNELFVIEHYSRR